MLVIILLYNRKRYYKFLPTIPLYPNNIKASLKVLHISKSRNHQDDFFFKLTDPSVVFAFKPYVKETHNELTKIILSINKIIFFFKYLFNRARPEQINKEINLLDSKTAATPAFPAGHAMQAYYLAKILTKRYPNKKSIFTKLAKDCDDVRVKAGIHYPSDGKFSKFLVKFL
tara:strand:- start:936 stop:1451 length:516 start_codon:yes stop_codon:yes gene_type:complete